MAQFTLLAVAPAASMLPAPDARAQGSACDQLKATLAARIDPSIRGFSLDTVSAGTPVPTGAKVIGTCEGGAYKILFRRSGGAPLPGPAPAASPVVAAPSRAAAPPAPASQAAVRPRPGPSPAAATELPKPSAAAPDTSAVTPPPSTAAVTRPADAIVPSSVATPAASETPMTTSGDDAAPLTQRALALLGRYWYAVAALAVLTLAPPLWAWAAHRRAYDASGLPRGPRIR